MNTSTANNNKPESLFLFNTEQTEKTEGSSAAFLAKLAQTVALCESFSAPPRPFSLLSEELGVKL